MKLEEDLKTMFIHDKPIESEEDDLLGRKRFSQHLGKALLDWKEKESLVIAIYGEWGAGKSSLINLARESINKSQSENKPTILEFNPWVFSEEDSLGEHFFSEIAKELEIKNDTDKDERIAKKLKLYASLLDLAPGENLLTSLSSKTLPFLALIGITSSQIISWFNIPNNWVQHGLLIGGLFFVILEIFKEQLDKVASFFEKKSAYHSKSVLEVKGEIKNELVDRQKKLIIVIDDIDRLNQSEIRQVFRLIRVNADFPNTIYLLAFDRNIIEKNLEEQAGVAGKDYLNKIVQVNFDIPFANLSKISTFLFKELDRILSVLPESAHTYFEKDDPYWANVYHSGLKDFFKNIRDVKRFASSLEFNISQMYQSGIMEVNPIDFIAIEAIRVFASDFYVFMRDENALFTSTNSNNRRSNDSNPRKDKLEQALSSLPNESKESILELVKRLFPQINDIYQHGYSTYGHEWQLRWSNKLRVCATRVFDSYFTMIPGGDEQELSQFEVADILDKIDSLEKFENILRDYIEKKRIRKLLQRIQDFTIDKSRVSHDEAKNIIKALFNISDDLPDERECMWDLGIDVDLMRVIYQLLKRETDKDKVFEMLKESIRQSKGLYAPIQRVFIETSKEVGSNESDDSLVPEDKFITLQDLCVYKIKNASIDDLLKHKHLVTILYRWKEWDKNGGWKKFVGAIEQDNNKFLSFIGKFISERRSQTIGDYGEKITKRFNYKDLSEFSDLELVKNKLEDIKKQNSEHYIGNKANIDLYLDNYETKV